jgi:preprotein translocase subunit SecA
LEHLEKTQDSIQTAWGIAEFTRLASYTTENLTEKTRRGLQNALGEAEFAQIQGTPLQNLPAETRSAIVTELGRQALTEIYRELLLRVISELWIEYLTQMEALRVSIGLEAYGQRDPLVQYKGRASQLFQELISNIRLGVVTRMFTFRPRDLSAAQAGVSQGEVIEAEFIETDEPDDESAETEDSVESPDSADEPEAAAAGGSNKRSRRRRRRK